MQSSVRNQNNSQQKTNNGTKAFFDVLLLGSEAVLPAIAVTKTYQKLSEKTESEGLRWAGAAVAGIATFGLLEAGRRAIVGPEQKTKETAQIGYGSNQVNGYPEFYPGCAPLQPMYSGGYGYQYPAQLMTNPFIQHVSNVPYPPASPEDKAIEKAVDEFNEGLEKNQAVEGTPENLEDVNI